MSELTLTLIRLGLLVLLWVFIFSITTVLRSDLYGTQVSRRVLAKRSRPAPGGRQPAQPPTGKDPAQPPRPARQGARVPIGLVVTEGELAGTSLPLGRGGVLIGRSPECTLVLDDEFSSGRHARIFPGSDGWLVEDLGSRNGTFLGGQKLTGTTAVSIGSVLRIGRTTLELRG